MAGEWGKEGESCGWLGVGVGGGDGANRVTGVAKGMSGPGSVFENHAVAAGGLGPHGLGQNGVGLGGGCESGMLLGPDGVGLGGGVMSCVGWVVESRKSKSESGMGLGYSSSKGLGVGGEGGGEGCPGKSLESGACILGVSPAGAAMLSRRSAHLASIRVFASVLSLAFALFINSLSFVAASTLGAGKGDRRLAGLESSRLTLLWVSHTLL